MCTQVLEYTLNGPQTVTLSDVEVLSKGEVNIQENEWEPKCESSLLPTPGYQDVICKLIQKGHSAHCLTIHWLCLVRMTRFGTIELRALSYVSTRLALLMCDA